MKECRRQIEMEGKLARCSKKLKLTAQGTKFGPGVDTKKFEKKIRGTISLRGLSSSKLRGLPFMSGDSW